MSHAVPEFGDVRPVTTAATESKNGWIVAVFYTLMLSLALLPILAVTIPPLIDYPNHLARMHILSEWENSPALRANYDLNWRLQPNLAMDLLVPFMTRFMSIYDAGRLFVAATMVILLVAPLCLRWVLYREIGILPSLLFLFLYNHILHWGFLNYLFTAGLAILAFSGWIATRSQPPWSRAALFSVVSLILYFGHLMGLMVFGLLVCGYELQLSWRRGWRHKDTMIDWLVSAGQFAVPAILFVQWAINNNSTHKAVTAYGNIHAKMNALLSPIQFGMPVLDLLTALFLGSLIVYCKGYRNATLTQDLKMPLLLMTAAAVIMPTMLSDVWGTDLRLPTIIACVLIAGTRFNGDTSGPLRLITSIAIILFSVRILFVMDLWHGVERNYTEFRQAVRSIPSGATAFAIGDKSDALKQLRPYHAAMYWHMATLAVIERSLFVPTLFTGHTTVKASSKRLALDSPNGIPVKRSVLAGSADPETSPYKQGHQVSRYNRLFWIGWPETFDYIISIRFNNTKNPEPERLERLYQGSYFDLYKVTPSDR
jgi:hypothetical protein